MTEKPLHSLLLQLLTELDKIASASPSEEEERLLARLSRRLAPWNEAREALDQQTRIARIHFDYALAGIVETDAQWRIARINPAALSITRRIPRLLLNTPLDQLFSCERPEVIKRHLDLLREQGISHSEILFEVAPEEFLNINLSSIQADEALFIHYIDDVTSERRHARELAAATAAAEAANRAKDRFLANVSHEIRTPLNGIVGLTHLCLMSECDTRQRDLLGKISRSGKTLQTILNDLLDFAKIESGKLQYEHTTFDLYEVLDDLATITAHSAVGKPLEIAFNIAPDIPRHLQGDRLRLSQILNNLLSNAIKFTHTGYVSLLIEQSSSPTLSAASIIRFTVADSGEGISEETLGRLFQPFTQADSSTTRRFGGTGLGLVIARQLAHGMKGELQVKSVYGHGSAFILELPLCCPADAQKTLLPPCRLALVSEQPRTAEAMRSLVSHLGGQLLEDTPGLRDCIKIIDLPSGSNIDKERLAHLEEATLLLTDAAEHVRLGALALPRADLEVLPRPLTPLALLNAVSKLLERPGGTSTTIDLDIPDEFRGALVALTEDIQINQEIMVGLLEKAGIEVIVADNGLQLLHKLQAASRQPELIFMDVHMPVLDGFDTTRQLRTGGWQGPVIGLSAGVSETERQRCDEIGMNDFLAKPVDLDDLWGVLTRWLPPRQDAAASLPSALPQEFVQTNRQRLETAGIDVATALPRFLGNEKSLYKAIGQLSEQHAQAPEHLTQLLANGDNAGVFKLCHALKGAAAAIGASTLAQHSTRLESWQTDGDLDTARALVEGIRNELEKLRAIHRQPTREA